MHKLSKSAAMTLAFILSAFIEAPSLAQPPTETRTYDVLVDDKPGGHYQLHLTSDGDKTDVISDCEINTKVLFVHYHYLYHAHESWSGTRLKALDSKCDDNGKHTAVKVVSSADGLQLTVNDKPPRAVDSDTLLSSYWFLPKSAMAAFKANYLEVDSGRLFNAQLKKLGEEPISVGKGTTNCKHYRLTGGDEDDLWYDEQNRLVRQTSSDMGHKTTIQLRSVDRT